MPECFAYVGCRTSRERRAIGEGISLFAVGADGRWTLVDVMRGFDNPSWLTLDRTKRILFAAHGDRTEVSAFGIDPRTRRLTHLNTADCSGWNPVHLTVDRSNRFLIVTNHVAKTPHRSGLASLPISTTGHLGEVCSTLVFEGEIGPHRVEQPFPKPHQAEWDPSGRILFVPDKGTNELILCRLRETGALERVDAPALRTRETAGPRHVAFHPGGRFAYVVNELDSTIAGYAFDPETNALRALEVHPTARPICTTGSRGAEVAVSPDGRFVYASTRGDDTIAAFRVDLGNGTLTLIGWTETGATPRFFTTDPSGRQLFVAAEDGHTIDSHAIDPVNGLLKERITRAEVGSPTCIVFVPG